MNYQEYLDLCAVDPNLEVVRVEDGYISKTGRVKTEFLGRGKNRREYTPLKNRAKFERKAGQLAHQVEEFGGLPVPKAAHNHAKSMHHLVRQGGVKGKMFGKFSERMHYLFNGDQREYEGALKGRGLNQRQAMEQLARTNIYDLQNHHIYNNFDDNPSAKLQYERKKALQNALIGISNRTGRNIDIDSKKGPFYFFEKSRPSTIEGRYFSSRNNQNHIGKYIDNNGDVSDFSLLFSPSYENNTKIGNRNVDIGYRSVKKDKELNDPKQIRYAKVYNIPMFQRKHDLAYSNSFNVEHRFKDESDDEVGRLKSLKERLSKMRKTGWA